MSECKSNGPAPPLKPDSELLQSALRTNLFLRALSLARLSLAASSRHASDRISGRISGFFSSEEDAAERLKHSLLEQSRSIALELGKLKGSVMKVGQMISIYGEHFLPPEANAILKSLQCQAPPLDWNRMEEVLASELDASLRREMEIEQRAKAAASLGQVHVSHILGTNEKLALKIQYPGVERAVHSDLRALKTSLSLARVFSHVPHLDRIFLEVQEMLAQELDYRIEAENMESFRDLLASDPHYKVPRVHHRFSSQRVLATEFIDGVPLDGDEVLSLPQKRRDQLGHAMLDLYFREIFEFHAVQTDPHFGNYQVLLANDDDEIDQLVLFDFGAVRRFDEAFVASYRKLTLAALNRDGDGVISAAREIGFIEPGDPEGVLRSFTDLCFLAMEPFLSADHYDWSSSDLPKRLGAQLGVVIESYRFRPPPREILFLDRKSIGVFTALTVLGAQLDCRAILERRL